MIHPTDSYLALVGTYTIHPDDALAFRAIAAQCVTETVQKPGCLYFTIAEDVAQRGVFHLSEGWADRAALDTHLASAAFAETVRRASQLRLLHREAYVAQAQGRTSLFA